jgi:hypothetical protein
LGQRPSGGFDNHVGGPVLKIPIRLTLFQGDDVPWGTLAVYSYSINEYTKNDVTIQCDVCNKTIETMLASCYHNFVETNTALGFAFNQSLPIFTTPLLSKSTNHKEKGILEAKC